MEHQKITKFRRWWRMHFVKRTPGICVVCGCTETSPCLYWRHGVAQPCWWHDRDMTICSHCADPKIFNDPETVHCINNNHNRP